MLQYSIPTCFFLTEATCQWSMCKLHVNSMHALCNLPADLTACIANRVGLDTQESTVSNDSVDIPHV